MARGDVTRHCGEGREDAASGRRPPRSPTGSAPRAPARLACQRRGHGWRCRPRARRGGKLVDPRGVARRIAAPQCEMGAGIAASPHLRRALDLPVFISSGPKTFINDPGAPAQASDFHPTAPRRSPSQSLMVALSRGIRLPSGPTRPDRSQSRPMFLGPSWVGPFALSSGTEVPSQCGDRKTNSSGASDRLVRLGSEDPPHRLSAEIGTLGSFVPKEAGTFRPDHIVRMTRKTRFAKRGIGHSACG